MTYRISTHRVTADNTAIAIAEFSSGDKKMVAIDFQFGDLKFDAFYDDWETCLASMKVIIDTFSEYHSATAMNRFLGDEMMKLVTQ